MDFDHLEQVKALADAPMAPPATPKGSAWGAIKAAGRGVVAAGAEVFSQLESLHASGNWEENGDPNDPINVERRRSRQLSIEYAKRYGDYARSLRPDPATAGTAEQVLFGLSKGLTKAVTAVSAMGPAAGAVAFGGSEAASTYTDLRHEGVDSGTAGQAAAVSGVLNAAGVLLPMAGQTLKATAALYLAGGPGGYMAQQALTREVLSRAGYDEIAKKYDPLDPVGLPFALLFPLPFAAHGALRNVRAAKGAAVPDAAPAAEPAAATKAPEAAPHEAVDAAMVHNLTLLRDAHEATPPAKMAAEVARPVVTETPAFKKWFGASKLVDAEGLPAIFYHGTAADVAAFDVAKLSAEGIHLTSDPGKASTYAVSRAMDNGRGANVLPVYVVAEKIKDVPIITTDEIRQAVAEGFDAVRRDDHVVVMQPTQIKSAIGNSGLFDPESPSLTDPMPAAAIASTSGPIVPPGGSAGGVATVLTERGMATDVRYRVVDAAELVTSHNNDLAANPAFPQELQPRDRSRSASADQIARIENGLRPELLGDSVKASDGAPIVGPDLVVESGNARTIALRRAYGSGKAEAYRGWLTENAQRFGLQRDQIAAMQRPVLVRERIGNVDRAEFARQANESAVAAMSPAEQAKADASRLNDLSGLVANEDGTINMARSGDLVRQFVQHVIAPTERGAMLQADGRLSQAGQLRLRNAIFSRAYGDPSLVQMLAESTDGTLRNVLAGLMRAAPEMARLRDLAAAGARQPIDVAGDVAAAVKQLAQLKADGMTVEQYLGQGSLLGDGLPPQVQNLLVGLSENARAPKRIAEMLRGMVDTVDAMGDPRQAGMFGDAPASAADVAANAVERLRSLTDDQIKGVETALPAPSADPVLQQTAARVQELEATAGDMLMRVEPDGTRATLADDLAAVRKEAAEGTDAELGALDADLVRVAAECAMSLGA